MPPFLWRPAFGVCRPAFGVLLCFLAGCQQHTSPTPPSPRQPQPRFSVRKGRTLVTLALTPAQTGLPLGRVSERLGRQRLQLRLHKPAAPPVLARYRQTPSTLELTPAMRLLPGNQYIGQNMRSAGKASVAMYRVPALRPQALARVLAVYPGQHVLPANQLKFYVRFSAPMQGGHTFFDGVRLFDETNKREIIGPWRRLPLWSQDRQTATILFHPGRVKRGIGIAKVVGPVLHTGRRYRLQLDTKIRDAQGRSLAAVHTRRFTVVDADRRSPDPRQWRITAPAMGTYEPLIIHFDEALDFGLITEALTIINGKGRVLTGTSKVGPGERSFVFVPNQPWSGETYRLNIHAKLAMDGAGNSIARRFDAPIGESFRRDTSLTFRPKRQPPPLWR